MNGDRWLQGQCYVTNITDQNLAVWAHHITSTQNYRIICGILTCFNYEMNVSNSNSESHARHCMSESTDMTSISTCFITCMLRVRARVCVQVHKRKWRQYVHRFHYTQQFTKQPARTYRLHSSDCCWGRFLEAVFLRHACPTPIETNINPTLTFPSTGLHDQRVHFIDLPQRWQHQSTFPFHRRSSVKRHRCRASTTTKNGLCCNFSSISRVVGGENWQGGIAWAWANPRVGAGVARWAAQTSPTPNPKI